MATIPPFDEHHDTTSDGRPDGGYSESTGVAIRWQRGAFREQGTDQPATPNGAFVETVIAIARGRLQHYQDSPFECQENADAIAHLDAALGRLHDRTAGREQRGVEGTHTP